MSDSDADGADGAADLGLDADLRAAARDLLVDLVSIPSPTGEEREAAERLAAFFEERDREVRIDDAGNVRAPADDGVLLTSHIDTVPGDISVRIEGGTPEESRVAGGEEATLWGRGSVDATGPLSSMAAAAVETGVSFVGVVGEETDSRGARHLLDDRAAPDALINGEPSGWDGLTLGYRGFLAGRYEGETASAHTSRPDPNAIQNALAWWDRVADAFDEREEQRSTSNRSAERSGDRETPKESQAAGADGPGDSEERSSSSSRKSATSGDSEAHRASGSRTESDEEETPVFERVTAKPVGVDGGTAADGLAVEASLEAQFRLPPGRTAADVRAVAEDALGEGADLSWAEPIPPVMESPRTELARAFRVAVRGAGGDPRLLRKTGTSDMNLFAGAWDCPMVTYGPGDSDLDHAPDERLSLAEFDRALAVLIDVCERVATGGERA